MSRLLQDKTVYVVQYKEPNDDNWHDMPLNLDLPVEDLGFPESLEDAVQALSDLQEEEPKTETRIMRVHIRHIYEAQVDEDDIARAKQRLELDTSRED